jgi:hypothetical protein
MRPALAIGGFRECTLPARDQLSQVNRLPQTLWPLGGDARRGTARSQSVFITAQKACCQGNAEFGLDQLLIRHEAESRDGHIAEWSRNFIHL